MGKLTSIGEITFEDETRTGAFIECSREELKKISELFLEEVEIIQAQPKDSADTPCEGLNCKTELRPFTLHAPECPKCR